MREHAVDCPRQLSTPLDAVARIPFFCATLCVTSRSGIATAAFTARSAPSLEPWIAVENCGVRRKPGLPKKRRRIDWMRKLAPASGIRMWELTASRTFGAFPFTGEDFLQVADHGPENRRSPEGERLRAHPFDFEGRCPLLVRREKWPLLKKKC